MTAASRRLLGALLAVAFVAAAAPGQDPAPPAEPATADPKNPMTQILGTPAQPAPDAMGDMVSFLFVICCLAAGVMAVAVAARVYARVRHDDPIIAAINDPWVQAKIARDLAAGPDAKGEVELSPADGRPPGHH